jgi:hypothetical protein
MSEDKQSVQGGQVRDQVVNLSGIVRILLCVRYSMTVSIVEEDFGRGFEAMVFDLLRDLYGYDAIRLRWKKNGVVSQMRRDSNDKLRRAAQRERDQNAQPGNLDIEVSVKAGKFTRKVSPVKEQGAKKREREEDGEERDMLPPPPRKPRAVKTGRRLETEYNKMVKGNPLSGQRVAQLSGQREEDDRFSEADEKDIQERVQRMGEQRVEERRLKKEKTRLEREARKEARRAKRGQKKADMELEMKRKEILRAKEAQARFDRQWRDGPDESEE